MKRKTFVSGIRGVDGETNLISYSCTECFGGNIMCVIYDPVGKKLIARLERRIYVMVEY